MGTAGLFLSYTGISGLVMLIDPAMRDVWMFPLTAGIQERFWSITLFGALAGFFTGVLQRLAVDWAWEQTSSQDRFTARSWIRFLVCLPLAVALGALCDGTANAQLRAPYQMTHRLIKLTETMPPDLETKTMPTALLLDYVGVSPWREHFSKRYVHRIADYNPRTLDDVVVDVEFDNGYIWRCDTTWNGYVLRGCRDLRATYSDWVSQFLRTGAISCDQCFVTIDPAAAIWQVQYARALGAPSQIMTMHHGGGVVVVRADTAAGKVECRLVGANPTIVRDCARR
jgi:hypothetical protein